MSEGNKAVGAPAVAKVCLECGSANVAYFDCSRDIRSRCLIDQDAAFDS